MAVPLSSYWPFDGQAVGESQWTAMATRFFGDGVIKGVLNDLGVYADSSGMQVKVPSGLGCWHAHMGEQTSEVTLPISAPHATLARYDRVVVRVDWVGNQIVFDVVAGTPAASPGVPVMMRTGTVWEFSLARITVAAAAGTIAAGDVTDERDDASVCGYAYSPYPTQVTIQTRRPTTFPIGAFIYERDTQRVFVNTGTQASPVWTQLTAATLSFGAPAFTLGTANTPGAAGTTVRTDAGLALFDATVPTNQAIGDVAAAGAVAFAERAGHRHGMPGFATPGSQAIGDTPLDGVAPTLPHSDHRHGMPAFATPAFVLGTAAAPGSALTLVRSDATLPIFGATLPVVQAFGDSPAAGVLPETAHADHRHGMPSSSVGVVAKIKTADETVNNTTVAQNDDDLFFPVLANEKWTGLIAVGVDSANTADIAFQFTCPVGGTVYGTAVRQPVGDNASPSTVELASWAAGLGGLGPSGTGSNYPPTLIPFSYIGGANAGYVQLTWAQAVAVGANTVVKAGSFLFAIKVG